MAISRATALLAGATSLLFPPVLSAQKYQSNFSPATFDRAKSPSTIHGGAKVDLATGALSMEVPMGPGIGARGVHYRPTLSLRSAPHPRILGALPQPPYGQWTETSVFQTTSAPEGGTSCLFSPGFITIDLLTSIDEVRLPSGEGFSILSPYGQAPPDAQKVLAAFGITDITSADFKGIGPSGEAVFYLEHPVICPARWFYTWAESVEFPPPAPYAAPDRILVVSEDGAVATEYQFVQPIYQQFALTNVIPSLPPVRVGWGEHSVTATRGPIGHKDANHLRQISYLPIKIRNRFKDVIDFDHKPNGVANGINFNATWRRGNTMLASIEVRLFQSLPALTTMPALNNYTGSVGAGAKIRVSYPGTTNSTYTLSAYGRPLQLVTSGDTWLSPVVRGWDSFRRELQPSKLTADATNESIEWTYKSVGRESITQINKISFPTRTLSLQWSSYKYRRVAFDSLLTGSGSLYYQNVGGAYSDIWTTYGVTQLVDQSLSSPYESRITNYTRVVPTPDLSYKTGPYWSDTNFHVAVSHPDGRTTVTKYAQPINGDYVTGESPSSAFQNVAFLKHVPVEIREYASGVIWENDINQNPDSQASTAHKVQVSGSMPTAVGSVSGEKSRFACTTWTNGDWSFASFASPSGGAGYVPYPIRSTTIDKDSVGWLRTIIQRSNWDQASARWWTETLSADKGSTALIRVNQRTYSSDRDRWLLGKLVSEQKTGEPLVTNEYNDNGTLNKTTWSSLVTPSIYLKYDYTEYPDLPWPSKITLNSTASLINAGSVGAVYSYDGFGYLESIKQLGATWGTKQINDCFGRPISQIDPNNNSVSYSYDQVGRLTNITPKSPEVGTSINYPDLYTAVTTRGSRTTSYKYSGFGELVSINRSGAIKQFFYDIAGRNTFESVWRSKASTSTADGTITGYDSKNRVISMTYPVKATGGSSRIEVRKQYSYGGSVEDRTQNGLMTRFYKDSLGRLTQVDSPLGPSASQVTTYAITSYQYDDANRLTRVEQFPTYTPASNGLRIGSGASQVRSWSYNGLGWCTQLNQPESGITDYSNFTVTGKPTTTTYGFGTPNPKVVTTQFDTLDRPVTVTGPGGLQQSFAYDGGGPANPEGALQGAVNGNLTYSQDGVVEQWRTYGGLNGRIDSLLTQIWSGPTLNTGNPFRIPQTYGYDQEGRRTSLTVDGRAYSTTYDETKDLPKSILQGANFIAQASYDPLSWALASLSYGPSLTTAKSEITYGADQVRLNTLKLYGPSTTLKNSWTYSYDAFNRMTGDGQDSYSYDNAHRLINATVRVAGYSNAWQLTYNYDAFGNQIRSTSVQTPIWLNGFDFNINDQAFLKNRLPADGGAIYDDQGNLTSFFKKTSDASTNVALAYDAIGRVIAVKDVSQGILERYVYNSDGLRVRVCTYDVSGITLKSITYKIYNDQRQLISEYEEEAGGAQ